MSMILNLFRADQSELDAYLADTDVFFYRAYEDETPDHRRIDIDKSWDGLVFLLTGAPLHAQAGELYKMLFNHKLLDEKREFGYGPASYLTPEEVSYFNQKLENLAFSDIATNYDATKMFAGEVYPEIWEDKETGLSYLGAYYERLKAFYASAAQEQQGIITFLG